MIISIKTKTKWLNEIDTIPFLGGWLIFLVAAAPVPFLFALNGVFEFVETIFIERIIALIAAIWNLILVRLFKIKISMFFIPCWALFGVIGILRLLSVLD